MRDPTIQKVENLEPAVLYAQKMKREDPVRKIFSIRPIASKPTQRKAPLVFRTGAFRVGRVADKIVLEFSAFSDCLYIFYFAKFSDAILFLEYINETSQNLTLDITPDVLEYLKYGTPQPSTQNETELQLSLGKHPRHDQESSRNVRTRSVDDCDRDTDAIT